MDLIKLIAKRWWVVASSIFAAVCVGIIIVRLSPPTYQVTMTVAPVEAFGGAPLVGTRDFQGSIGSLLSSRSEPESIDLYKSLLTSVSVLKRTDVSWHILRKYFRDEYDLKKHSWRRPQGIFFDAKSALYRMMRLRPWYPPSLLQLQTELRDNITFRQSPGSPLLTISLLDRRPKFAAELLAHLDSESNEVMRLRLMQQSYQQVTYLSRLIATTSDVAQRASLLSLLQTSERNLALAQPGATSLIEFTEKPFPPTRPYSPKPVMILLLASVLGTLIGCAASITLPATINGFGDVVRAIRQRLKILIGVFTSKLREVL